MLWPVLAGDLATDALAQDAGLTSPEATAGADPQDVPDPAAGIAGDPEPPSIAPADDLRQTSPEPALDQTAGQLPDDAASPDPADLADDDFAAPSQIAPEEPAESPPPPDSALAPEPADDVADPNLAEPNTLAETADAPPPPVIVDEPEPAADVVVVPPPPPDVAEDEDPYSALGYKVGAFRLYPSIESELQYTDNIFKSQALRRSDTAAAFRSSLSLESQWERHELDVSLDAERSFHRTYSSEDDNTVNAELSGRLDITSITNIEGDLGYSYDQLERGTLDGSQGIGERQNQRQLRYGGAFNQRLNHFTVRLRGVATYADEQTPELTVDPALCAPSNPDPQAECGIVGQDYQDRLVALRLGYEFYEGLEIFADGDRHWRKFASLDGEPLGTDSHGFTLRGGISAELGPVWRGFLAVGVGEETPEDRRIGSLRSTLAEAQLVWTPSVLTTVTFAASRGVTTTTLRDSAGSIDSDASVEVRHELRRYLALLAGYAYSNRDFGGTGETETERIFRLGTEFDIDRTWMLFADYRYIDLDADTAGASYNENQFRIGLRAQR